MSEQRPEPSEQPATGSAPEPAGTVDATLVRNNVLAVVGIVEAIAFGYWLVEGSGDLGLLGIYLLGGLIAIPAGVVVLLMAAVVMRGAPSGGVDIDGGGDGGDVGGFDGFDLG